MKDTKQPTSAKAGGIEMENSERLIGPRDVAEMCGLPISWVYSKAEEGILPHFKLGKYLKFRESEVTHWLEEQRNKER